ncbi:MAG TPA: superoxide dismutase family protein [Gammaproteobacteria bacterium]|nr:superoxide dismutase family protein [Gammaproteobacteria bacterium]
MTMKKMISYLVTIFISVSASVAQATLKIPMYLVDENGQQKSIGIVQADDTIYGLLLTPKLQDLPPGVHGFHIHQFPLCGQNGMMAGGHLDPLRTDAHRGPYRGDGHLGDLPVLLVDARGRATLPVLAPRLKLAQIENRTLMIHVGSDNYSDKPEKLGGGDGRMACGIVPYY